MVLAACGGGGGGGGSSATDPSTAPGITVSPTSVAFAAVQNGAIPPAQSIQITLSRSDVARIVISDLATPTSPNWLTSTPSITNSGPNNITFTGGPITTSLAPGTYSTTLRFAIQDAGGNDLAYRDVQVSYTITATPIAASPNALNFSSVVGGAAPAAQPVTLMGGVGSWTSLADQPWIGVAPSSGNGVGSVNISVNPAGLVPNTYNGSVTFSSGANTATVNVSLTVAAPAIQTNLTSLSYSGVNGAVIPSQSLTIGMNNGAVLSWTAATPPADSWLVLNRTSGTASDPLGVSVNPANGTLASGTYNSSISLQGSSGGSTFGKTVNVTMTLTKATLTPNPVSVTLGGANGRDFSGVPVQLSLNTGVNSFSWNSTASSFIQRSPPSGSVSATPQTLTLTPNATGLTGGTHSGSVTFSTQINGDTVSTNLPVTFNQESHKLLVDGNGVAFAKTPTLSKLTQTLRVRDNLGLATPWTATADQSWLSVTASGTADANIVFTANPTGLTPDSLNLATVTIASSDASVENTEKVRVGLWVGLADPTATTISVTTANVAADPIRPYAYAAVGRDISVYNIHTGLPVTTIMGVAAVASTVGYMTVSHDGSMLYAVDTTSSKIVPVNLDSSAVGTAFSFTSFSSLKVIDYTRTNGVELIISGSGGQIFNATGTLFPSTFAGNTVVTASRGGTRLCTVDVGVSAYSISCPTLDFTSLNGGQLLLGNTFTVSGISGNGMDVALKGNGATLYVASGGVTELSAYLTSGQNPTYVGSGLSPAPTGLHPNNAEIAADGRIIASAANPGFGTADVWIFDANGAPLATRKIAAGGSDQIFNRQLRISGDGIRLITISGDPFFNTNVKLNFTTIGP